MKQDLQRFAVDPARLAHGEWCHRAQKTLGRGDIAASYSADCIGMDQPIRKPFEWQGGLWVCVGDGPYDGTRSFQAYRLLHPSCFNGMPTTYREKLRDADAARADPLGFYHGMRVKHAGALLVMAGRPVLFVPGVKQQLDLFS